MSAGLSQADCNVLLSEPAAVWFPSFANEVSGELKINIETIADLNEMLTGKMCFQPGQEYGRAVLAAWKSSVPGHALRADAAGNLSLNRFCLHGRLLARYRDASRLAQSSVARCCARS